MTTSGIVALVAAGLAFLIAGLVVVRRQLAGARGLEKLIVCGPALVASALATFGTEHLVMPRGMVPIVPVWMPWRLFWVYFVAAALFAAALSYVARKYMRYSTCWLAALFWILAGMTTVPGLMRHPDNRLFWVLAVPRDYVWHGGVCVWGNACGAGVAGDDCASLGGAGAGILRGRAFSAAGSCARSAAREGDAGMDSGGVCVGGDLRGDSAGGVGELAAEPAGAADDGGRGAGGDAAYFLFLWGDSFGRSARAAAGGDQLCVGYDAVRGDAADAGGGYAGLCGRSRTTA